MKAKTLAELFKALGNTSFAKKNTEDVEELNSVRIVCNNGFMQIIATNSRISTACKIPNIKGNFSIYADNTVLPSCIEAAADNKGEVEFRFDNQKNILFVVGNATVPIAMAAPKNTKFGIVKGTPVVSALSADIIKAANASITALGKDSETLHSINLSFNTNEQTFKMSAFNGVMMCSANIPLEDMAETAPTNVLVNGEDMKAILPLLKFVKSQIMDITIEGNRIMFSTDNIKICMNCRFDKFVDINKLLQSDFSSYVTFNTKELKKQIDSIYKAVKTDICFTSDGTSSMFSKDNFSMPGKFIKSNTISFDIPIYTLKNIIGNIVGETVTISVANKILIRVMSEDSDDVIYVTSGVKQ